MPPCEPPADRSLFQQMLSGPLWGLLVMCTALVPVLPAQAAEGAVAPAKWADLKRRLDARFPGVPTLSTEELADRLRATDRSPPLLVDVRAREEFEVSHLRGAIWAGTAKTQADLLRRTPPNREIVFYCSVGWRSAQATERALKAGRAGVSDLGGSIFQWANEGRPLVGMNEKTPTTFVHPYDDTWGQMLDRRLWSRQPVR